MSIVEGVFFLYTVQPGDTLYSIASRFGSTVQLIEQTNALYPPVTDPGLIFPGQLLVISERGLGQRSEVYYYIRPGDTLYSIGLRFSAIPDLMVGLNPLITNPNVIYAGVPIVVPAVIYEVESGDSLYRISRQLGIPLNDLIRANQGRPGFSPDVIFPGYRLIVPLPSSNNIVVFRPLPGSRIQPGQAMEGMARAFEAQILYRLIDDNGADVIAEKGLMASAGAPSYGTFSTVLQFDRQPTAAAGELWVYARSARDGSIIDLTQVRVRF